MGGWVELLDSYNFGVFRELRFGRHKCSILHRRQRHTSRSGGREPTMLSQLDSLGTRDWRDICDGQQPLGAGTGYVQDAVICNDALQNRGHGLNLSETVRLGSSFHM